MSAAALTPPPRPFKEIDASETDEGTTGGVYMDTDRGLYACRLTHVASKVTVEVAGYRAYSYARSACLGALAVAVWVHQRQLDVEADTYIGQAEKGWTASQEHVERLGLKRYEGEEKMDG